MTVNSKNTANTRCGLFLPVGALNGWEIELRNRKTKAEKKPNVTPADRAAELGSDVADVASFERARAWNLKALEAVLTSEEPAVMRAKKLLHGIETSTEWKASTGGRPVMVLGRIGARNRPFWNFPAAKAVGWCPGLLSGGDTCRDLYPDNGSGGPFAYQLGLCAEGLVLMPEYTNCADDTGNVYVLPLPEAAAVLHQNGVDAESFVAMRDAAIDQLATLDLSCGSYADKTERLSEFLRTQRAAKRLWPRYVKEPPTGRWQFRARRLDP